MPFANPILNNVGIKKVFISDFQKFRQDVFQIFNVFWFDSWFAPGYKHKMFYFNKFCPCLRNTCYSTITDESNSLLHFFSD